MDNAVARGNKVLREFQKSVKAAERQLARRTPDRMERRTIFDGWLLPIAAGAAAARC